MNHSAAAISTSPPPMANFPIPTTLVILLLLALPASLQSSDSVVSQLSALQSKSPSGVIRLTDALLRRILSLPTPRPFHFLIFFDAHKLHSNPDLSLPTLKSEFSVVSLSFQSNNPNEKTLIFFFDVEFEESKASFALFGVESLPHVRLIPPSAINPKNDSIKMEASHLSRLAESMAEFLSSQTKLDVGPIIRPPAISSKQIIPIAAALLIWTVIFAKKLISGDSIFHDKSLWMGGAIFVYFFSVSGAMFTIIRKTPFFLLRENPDKVLFFYQGSGAQLGAEGFAVGFLYTTVGILLAFMTHALVRVRDKRNQRLIMASVLFAMFWAVKKVTLLANWKMGYSSHGYWPSSWR